MIPPNLSMEDALNLLSDYCYEEQEYLAAEQQEELEQERVNRDRQKWQRTVIFRGKDNGWHVEPWMRRQPLDSNSRSWFYLNHAIAYAKTLGCNYQMLR